MRIWPSRTKWEDYPTAESRVPSSSLVSFKKTSTGETQTCSFYNSFMKRCFHFSSLVVKGGKEKGVARIFERQLPQPLSPPKPLW